MNGSAVFLFAALRMKLNMAVRRRRERERGVVVRSGGLNAEERAAAAATLEVLLQAMDLPDDVRDAARAISPRRDRPTDARRLLDYFEAASLAGPTEFGLSSRSCFGCRCCSSSRS